MARRPRNRRRPNPLYQPSAQLAGRPLKRAAEQLADLEIRPQVQALDQQNQTVTRQGTALVGRAKDYYTDLARQAQGNVAMQTAIGQRLQQALTQAGDQSQSVLRNAAHEQEQRAAADASVRGQGLEGGSGQQAAREAAAARTRAAMSSQTAVQGAAAGTADYERLASLSDKATQARGGEVTQQLINRLANQQADIATRKTGVESQRGNLITRGLLGLRQGQFENQLTMAGLNLKEQDLAATVTDQQRDARLDRDRINSTVEQREADRISRERIAEANRESRERTARAKGDPKAKPEPVQSLKLKTSIEQARSEFNRLDARGWPEKKIRERALKAGVPLAVYKAVYDLERTGTLHPANAQALKALGVRIPPEWRRKPRPKVQTQTRPT